MRSEEAAQEAELGCVGGLVTYDLGVVEGVGTQGLKRIRCSSGFGSFTGTVHASYSPGKSRQRLGRERMHITFSSQSGVARLYHATAAIIGEGTQRQK